MKIVRENLNFERGNVSFPRMGIGKGRNSELRRAFIQAEEESEMLDKEGIVDWFENNPKLKAALEFDSEKEDPRTDLIGFDDDYYMDTYGFDYEKMGNEFNRIGPIRKGPSRGGGTESISIGNYRMDPK